MTSLNGLNYYHYHYYYYKARHVLFYYNYNNSNYDDDDHHQYDNYKNRSLVTLHTVFQRATHQIIVAELLILTGLSIFSPFCIKFFFITVVYYFAIHRQ